jgi:hypothetical protein
MRHKATLPRCIEHLSQVVILCQAIALLVKDSPINRNRYVSIGPEQSQKKDYYNTLFFNCVTPIFIYAPTPCWGTSTPSVLVLSPMVIIVALPLSG